MDLNKNYMIHEDSVEAMGGIRICFCVCLIFTLARHENAVSVYRG